ncbi:BRCT domain,Poly(ADP-ribose) polymerase, regulatory domain,WGR domain,PADR1 domain,Poly(ADP-ribose) [Cinara cedri]|uniref:Poly [ADP-ribose] polymerase n=1 Tax=Cinara cedri TaxID=506608 RepID=A0A5E4MLH0_9HEMI|nr:BRCT domain,Poly(ADP-ribose) polymerase, regulatory domain,WGR domain,PADR1 domain,Poly(ADP-ribose) [Cinara cedri]
MEEVECPYRAEYAKSNRSKCKTCKLGIEKDHLRLAVMIQSPLFDGKVPNWYHFNCFFIKQRPKDTTDIAHFESIRWEDQEKIKTKLASLVGTAVTPVSVKKKSGPQKKNLDFNVEYAKSGRAVCCGCQEKIVKSDVRIGKMDYESEEARRFGGLNRWYHVECFVKLREELEFTGLASSLNGYNILNAEDKNNLKNLLPILTAKRTNTSSSDLTDGPSASKKLKLNGDNSRLESEKKAQNKLLFKYVDYLKSLKSSICKELLVYNKQEIPDSNLGAIYDRLSDLMVFGSLLPCDECNGQLVFRSGLGYQCLGYKNEWLKCGKIFVDPPRVKFEVPTNLLEKDNFFMKYKSKIQKRIFTQVDKTQLKESSAVKNEKGIVKVTRILPLKNMEFTTLMKGTELKNIKFQVAKLGGTIVTQCTENVAAVLANSDSIKKKSVRVKDAEEFNIEVIEPTSFFNAIANGGNAIELIVSKNLAPWGGNAKQRIEKRQNELETEQMHKSSLKSKSHGKSMFEKSAPTSVKLNLKGGVPVDPQSGLEHKAHVYKHKNEVWNANLCLSDVQTDKNSYYKLQLLESDNNKRYWVFRSWGRIGTTIGSFKTHKFDSLEEAQDQFRMFYLDQTGNLWGNKNFVKIPGKKVPIDTDYGQDETKTLDTVNSIPCKLSEPVQHLIRLLFDVESMKKVMYEFELDLEKMPLGKLSHKQLQRAYSTLSELNEIMDLTDVENKTHNIIMATNKFYNLIPHNFGVKSLQLIDSKEILNTKLEMIGSLMEIQIAYNMIEVKTQEDSMVHPLDTYYLKLNCDIDVLKFDTNEFSIIEQYVKNTHAETHSTYSLKIQDVFKVIRAGEEKQFKPFKKLHNRKLLWHGSRITNFAAILSQGLRIAPKDAPVTGYMFGKGIYFADMVSKSANYCMASHSNNTGLLLLCEVALGNMDKHKQSIYIEKLPPGKHSCMGIGRTMPDPTESLLIESKLEVPLGKPVPSNVDNTALLYNEFIVYDISQVKLRYLVKVEFNFNY